MKVLHLIPSMGGGGAERQLTYLCRELARKGCLVHAAYLHNGPNLGRLMHSGAAVSRLAAFSNYDPILIFRIVRLIRGTNPDIVQTWLPQMDVLGGIAAGIAGVPFVMTERSSAPAYGSGWKDRLRLMVSARAVLIIANSEAGREYWLSMGRRQDRIAVVRNAVPFEEIGSLSGAASPADGAGDIGAVVFAGRYFSYKNVLVLLDAFRRVVEKKPDVVFHLYGEGPMLDDLINFSSQSGLSERILIRGYTPGLWGVLKAASLFVSVSTFEGHPNTVLEAIACGCPVVVSDIPAHREFLDDTSAWFVNVASADDIAEGITAALQDKAEAVRRAACARKAIARWSPSEVAAEHARLYENVRSRKAARMGTRRYSDSFGYQWNLHQRTQLDSATGLPISRDRLFSATGWPERLEGQHILEAGSGAGRFTEVLLKTGAEVFSFDYSSAVKANRANNGYMPNLHLFRGDIFNIPLPRERFDKVICLGVLQHTPDPEKAFLNLAGYVKPGGELVVDVYKATFLSLIQWKYLLRPLTRRMDKERLYRLVARIAPVLITFTRWARALLGRCGARLSPIVEYAHLGLSPEMNRDWAVLDTFDMYSPEHDHPQSLQEVKRWFFEAALCDAVVRYGPNGIVGKGRKPVTAPGEGD